MKLTRLELNYSRTQRHYVIECYNELDKLVGIDKLVSKLDYVTSISEDLTNGDMFTDYLVDSDFEEDFKTEYKKLTT